MWHARARGGPGGRAAARRPRSTARPRARRTGQHGLERRRLVAVAPAARGGPESSHHRCEWNAGIIARTNRRTDMDTGAMRATLLARCLQLNALALAFSLSHV